MNNLDSLFICEELPNPLSKEEFNVLFQRVQKGDKKAKDKLIEHNLRLVLFRVNSRFKYVEYDKKDLISLGYIGLLKAVNTFDVEDKKEFSTYASRCIDNEILMFLKKLKKDRYVYSIEEVIGVDQNGNELKIIDTISDKIDIQEEYIQKEIYGIVRDLIEKLPEREREIIKLYFGFYDGKLYTQPEIGKIVSFSRSFIACLIKMTLFKLKNQLIEIGCIEVKSEETEVIKKNQDGVFSAKTIKFLK